MKPVVLVTGASGGIGRATAERFHARGHRVLATARRAEDLEAITARGWVPIRLEMTDDRSVAEAAEAILREGPPTILINNAGYGELGPVEEVTRDVWRRQFETNVFGLFDLTRRLIPAMRDAGGGRIVNVSSVVGRVSIPYMGVYSASKHALEAASDALRVELRPWNIHVTLIEPGPVDTGFAATAESTLSGDPESPYARSHAVARKRIALFSRGLRPEAVARAIHRQATARVPFARRPVGLQQWVGIPFLRFLSTGLIDAVAGLALGLTRRRLGRRRG